VLATNLEGQLVLLSLQLPLTQLFLPFICFFVDWLVCYLTG